MIILKYWFDFFDVQGPPDDPVISGSNEAEEFDIHELVCDSNNGLPAGKILWSLGSRDITNSSQQTNTPNLAGRIDMRSVLRYDIRRQANGEQIHCEVRHPELSGPPFPEDTILMNVKCT